MRAADYAFSRILPPDLRRPTYEMTAKGIESLMAEVARAHPDKYADIAKQIGDLGRHAAWNSGYTVAPKDLLPVLDRTPLFARLDAEIAAVDKEKGLDEKEKARLKNEVRVRYSDLMSKETAKNAYAQRNAVALATQSGARGNAGHLQAILSTPGVYADEKGQIIPLFVRSSFAEGIRPAESLAGTYGGRSAVLSTKRCLLRGTLVQMADGTQKEIQDIKVGDMVVGANTEGVTFPSLVTATYDQGMQEVWVHRMRFSNSKLATIEVACTEDHKFLINDQSVVGRERSKFTRGNGYRPSSTLAHERAVVPIKRLSTSRNKMALTTGGVWQGGKSEPWAAFLGLILGDGGVTTQRATFSCADPIMLRDMEPILDTLGLKIKKMTSDPAHFGYNITTRNYNPLMNSTSVKGTQGFGVVGRVPMNVALEANGMRFKYAWEKELPPGIWGWDDASIIALIAAYFACDGSIYETVGRRGVRQVSITMASTSRSLIAGIKQILMMRFGIHCGNIDVRTKGGFGNSTDKRIHPLYSIAIGRHGCVARFANIFGPAVPGIKRTRMAEMMIGYTLKQDNPYAKMSLISREFIGMAPCHDIEVANEDHLFLLANGVITSNSTAKGGFFSKMLAQVAAKYQVTKHDCGTDNGIDLSADDPSLRGRVLARPVAGYAAGTVVDRHVMNDIKKHGKPAIVRSPMTCSAEHGLCAKCFGLESDGRLPKVGEHLGETASTALGEPVTQMALNCLVVGTQVLMADLTEKSIESIEVGDMVMGADVNGITFPVNVTRVWDQGEQETFTWMFDTGVYVTATANHQVLTTEGKRTLKQVFDSNLTAVTENGLAGPLAVVAEGLNHCFDISVDHPDELFVLCNGLIVKNSKHNAGQAKGGKKEFSGFEVINQFVQVPEDFRDRAALAEKPGMVDSVVQAPQGGHYISVDGHKHFVLPGLAPLVKVGDDVEQGQVLSDGLASPADVTRLRGLGEGRRYFADRFEKILTDSGMPPHRRRLEVIARAAVDNVRVLDGDDSHDWLPDDNVTEAQFNSSYHKPANTVRTKASNAVGKYLQSPALHYSIGTKLTPTMSNRLDQAGYEVDVSDHKPRIEPEMRRLQTSTHGSGDWLADMSTSYVKSQLQHNTERGADTNVAENYHYAPRLAVGVGFGENIGKTGKF